MEKDGVSVLYNLNKISDRGSYTVEAALLFSALILVLSCLVLSFMLMYHKVLLAKTASAVAQKAAGMWTQGDNLYQHVFEDPRGEKTYSETVKGAVDLEEKRSQIKFELESGDLVLQQKRFKTLQLAVYRELSRIVRKPEITTVTVDYKNYLLSREIAVTITQEMKIPFGSIKCLFDGKDTLTLVGTAAAAVTQPAEFVRNVDLFLEYAGKIKVADSLNRLRSWTGK